MTQQMQSLDFQTIERANEKFTDTREVVVGMEIDGKIEHFTVNIYKNFSPIQIKTCVQELIEKLDQVKAHDKNGFGDIVLPYMMFLVIKHFTTLNLPNMFAEQLKAIEHMTNTGVMFQIFMNIDEDEINNVKSEVQFVLDNFNNNMDEVEDFKNQIRNMLVDKSLLE